MMQRKTLSPPNNRTERRIETKMKTTYDMAIVLQRCLTFDADVMSYSQLKIFQCNQEYQQVRSNRHIWRAIDSFFFFKSVR